MIYSVARPIRSFLARSVLRYKFTTSNAYVPIRPLKQNRNVLFTVGQPTPVSKVIRLMVRFPFLGFLLEGLTNAFTWPVIGGMVFSHFFASYAIRAMRFMKSHEVFQLAVNKNLTKFQLVIPNTRFSREWEDVILRTRGTSFQAIFKQKLRNNTLDMSPELIEWYRSQNQSGLKSRIHTFRYGRKQLTIELDRIQIESIQMKSISEIRQRIIDRYLNKKNFNYFQHYSTQKTQKDFLTIQTRSIEGKPLYFYLNIKKNYENKYDEYIKALAEGKTIVNI